MRDIRIEIVQETEGWSHLIEHYRYILYVHYFPALWHLLFEIFWPSGTFDQCQPTPATVSNITWWTEHLVTSWLCHLESLCFPVSRLLAGNVVCTLSTGFTLNIERKESWRTPHGWASISCQNGSKKVNILHIVCLVQQKCCQPKISFLRHKGVFCDLEPNWIDFSRALAG